jgi:hypothetical protein
MTVYYKKGKTDQMSGWEGFVSLNPHNVPHPIWGSFTSTTTCIKTKLGQWQNSINDSTKDKFDNISS